MFYLFNIKNLASRKVQISVRKKFPSDVPLGRLFVFYGLSISYNVGNSKRFTWVLSSYLYHSLWFSACFFVGMLWIKKLSAHSLTGSNTCNTDGARSQVSKRRVKRLVGFLVMTYVPTCLFLKTDSSMTRWNRASWRPFKMYLKRKK